MKVRDAMAHTVSCAAPDDEVGTAAEMMRAEGAGFIPVVDAGRIVGVLTDRDIVVRGIAEAHGDPRDMRVGDLMTGEVTTIGPDQELEDAARLMNEREVRRLPVVEGDGRLVGVLSHGNLVQATAGAGPGMAATIGVTRGA